MSLTFRSQKANHGTRLEVRADGVLPDGTKWVSSWHKEDRNGFNDRMERAALNLARIELYRAFERACARHATTGSAP